MRTLFLCSVLIFCSGCIFKPINTGATYFPEVPIPKRPLVSVPETVKPGQSKDMDAMINNVYLTTEHIGLLEELIKAYNTTAQDHNDKVNKMLGLE